MSCGSRAVFVIVGWLGQGGSRGLTLTVEYDFFKDHSIPIKAPQAKTFSNLTVFSARSRPSLIPNIARWER